MSYAWFICPYKRITDPGFAGVGRYCAMDDFTLQIQADAGEWQESEILGNSALVKVRASDATIATIAGTAGFRRIPNHWQLSESLADLTTPQKNALNNAILSLGYTQAEINAASGGDWGTKSLNDLLAFVCTKRLKPRYDAGTDAIILDGPVQPVRPHIDVAFSVK